MKVLSLITLLVVVAACSNDLDHSADAPQGQGEPITLTAAMPGGNVQTRIGYVDSDEPGTGVSLTWTADDAFLAYTAAGERSLFTLSTGADSDKGTFTGTAPDATGKFNVFFPTMHTYKDATDSKLYASLAGQTQTGNKSMGHLAAYNFMRATVEDITQPVMFHHLLAMMRFDLTLTDYDATTDGAPVLLNLSRAKSDGTFDFGDKLELGNTAGAFTDGNSVQLNLRDIDLTDNSGVLRAYLMVPPFRVKTDNQLIITVTCAKGTVYRFTAPSPAADKSYEAGMRYRATCTLAKAAANVSVLTDDTQASASFSGGDGEAATPYLISSAADLKYLVETNTAKTNYAGKYFKLTTDIRVETTEWTPIGDDNSSFKGNFNGDGHTIGGKLAGKAKYFGFFGKIYNGTVERLHITADVTYSGTDYSYVGALIGYTFGEKRTTLLNCSNSGTVSIASDNGSYIGGLVGYSETTLILIGCNNLGAVINVGNSSKRTHIGGILGSTLSSSSCTMQNCCNYGAVTVTNSSSATMGGLVGNLSCNKGSVFTDCINYGALTMNVTDVDDSRVGGLFGEFYFDYNGETCSVHNCLNKGTISATSVALQGGLAGKLKYSFKLTIADCCADTGSGLDKLVGGTFGLYNSPKEDYTLPACPDGHIHRTGNTQ